VSFRTRGQGAFEYLLMLGGTVLVAVVVIVMVQSSAQGANNTLNESTGDYTDYVKGSVKDLLSSVRITSESPEGCVWSNPSCRDGKSCVSGTCGLPANITPNGCNNSNPSCPKGFFCKSNNVCYPFPVVVEEGCEHGNPLCGVCSECTGTSGSMTCTSIPGNCPINPTPKPNGCTYHNPDCPAGHDCVNNYCVTPTPTPTATPTATPTPIPNSGVSGSVTSGGTGLVGASVSISDNSVSGAASATSIGGGSYSISPITMKLSSGPVTVNALANGYIPGSLSATLNAGQTITGTNFALTKMCIETGSSCTLTDKCCSGDAACSSGKCIIPTPCQNLGDACGSGCCEAYVCNAGTCANPGFASATITGNVLASGSGLVGAAVSIAATAYSGKADGLTGAGGAYSLIVPMYASSAAVTVSASMASYTSGTASVTARTSRTDAAGAITLVLNGCPSDSVCAVGKYCHPTTRVCTNLPAGTKRAPCYAVAVPFPNGYGDVTRDGYLSQTTGVCAAPCTAFDTKMIEWYGSRSGNFRR